MWTPRPLQCVEVGRHGRYQRLALTSLHLGDIAHVEGGAAHHLNIEVPLVENPAAGLAYGRESLRQQRLERLTLFVAGSKLVGLAAQLVVVHRDEVILDRIHLFGDVAELLEKFALA